MRVENAVHAMAGTLVLTGTALAFYVSQWWLLLPAFVGANLLQWAFTGFCPADRIFRRLGLRSVCTDRP